MATSGLGNLGDPSQVLWLGRDDDVDIIRAPHHAPSTDSQAADENELRVRRYKAAK